MRITEIKDSNEIKDEASTPVNIPCDRIHSFIISRNMIASLLDMDLISKAEYEKIMVKNMDSFLPEIASLYH